MELKIFSLFDNLEVEKIKNLFKTEYPWEPLKLLKNYLLELIPDLPKKIPLKEPLSKNLFLTLEGEILLLNEIEIIENEFYFKGEKIEGAILYAGAILMNSKIFFEKNVIVEPFAMVSGPAYFSEGTQIRQGAYIRGSVYTGKNAVIGHTTEVKNSIFFTSAKAAHFAYVGDSILGKDVNLGAGTKLANLKFTKKEIFFEINGERISTGLKKLGAILGDNCQTGCNSVLQPGTILGKGSFVLPGKVAGPGILPPKTIIK